jgi:hypothetical protein
MLWQHLVGMFGADALNRKFGRQPPMEWGSALSYLSENQLRHGLDVLLRSGAEHMPSLPSFLASCRQAREWSGADADGVTLPAPIEDKWETAANNHLMAHVMLAAKGKSYFDPVQTRLLVEAKHAWADDMRAEDTGDGVPVDVQRAAWDDCIARAAARGAVGRCPPRAP